MIRDSYEKQEETDLSRTRIQNFVINRLNTGQTTFQEAPKIIQKTFETIDYYYSLSSVTLSVDKSGKQTDEEAREC